ncbi:MAG: hypothetical protein R2865_16605 [Deinococcales bacterium]
MFGIGGIADADDDGAIIVNASDAPEGWLASCSSTLSSTPAPQPPFAQFASSPAQSSLPLIL